MKLITCPTCSDIIALRKYVTRTCECGASWGQYTGDLSATYGGKAIPLGISNHSLIVALRAHLKHGTGQDFDAFVITKDCATFKQEICDA